MARAERSKYFISANNRAEHKTHLPFVFELEKVGGTQIKLFICLTQRRGTGLNQAMRTPVTP